MGEGRGERTNAIISWNFLRFGSISEREVTKDSTSSTKGATGMPRGLVSPPPLLLLLVMVSFSSCGRCGGWVDTHPASAMSCGDRGT